MAKEVNSKRNEHQWNESLRWRSSMWCCCWCGCCVLHRCFLCCWHALLPKPSYLFKSFSNELMLYILSRYKIMIVIIVLKFYCLNVWSAHLWLIFEQSICCRPTLVEASERDRQMLRWGNKWRGLWCWRVKKMNWLFVKFISSSHCALLINFYV